ncbi:MAG: ComEC/Rec2 family competence protein [bacterium]|nr:ComEC/Rec2 family competence protein [bacterium]
MSVFRFLSIQEPIKEGNVQVSGTLLEQPKIYDKWQYFDMDGYRVKAPSTLEVDYGDKLEIVGRVQNERLVAADLKAIGESKWQKGLFSIREKLKEKIFAALPEPQAALLAGIVLGVKQDLPADFGESLRKTGTIHVVVVSGYNISVVAGFTIGLVRFVRRQIAIILALLAIIFYTLLVGAEPPAVRAAIMGVVGFTAIFLGRQRYALYSLFLAAFLMIFVNPKVVGEIGFQLSFLATAGIILFQERIYKFLKFLPGPFSDDLATTLAAQSLVVPIIFYHFGSVSAISPVVNAAVLWTIPLATILGFLFLATSFIVPILAAGIGSVIWGVLSIFVFLVELFGKLSFAYLHFTPKELLPVVIYYVFLLVVIIYLKNVRLVKPK